MTRKAPLRRVLPLAFAAALCLGCDRPPLKGKTAPETVKEAAEAAEASPAPQRQAERLTGSEHDRAAQDANPASTHSTPLLPDWPAPKAALFLTGRQNGYLEPCGCTGLANQKGGLARRHALLRMLGEKQWPVVALDVGNQVRRFGRQAEIQFQITTEALAKLDYKAVAFGPDDLKLSLGELAATVAGDSSPFLAANVNVLDLTPQFRVIEIGGSKLGVTAVLGADAQQQVAAGEIVLVSAEDGLRKVMPELTAQKCDYYLLLAHATLTESKELARKFPEFHLVISAGGSGEPFREAEPIEGAKARLVQVGEKSMYAGIVGLYDDPAQPIRYHRAPLDDRLKDSPQMLELLALYQDTLKGQGFEGLGLRLASHPSGREFVGSKKCGECHTKAFAIWEKTPHAHATESIVHPPERSEIARHFDPECLSCHVTGWNPQGFYPYQSGFKSLEASAHLTGSGCENCHGPGSAHAAAESDGADASALARLREEMRLPLAAAEKKCLECHDLDNSPDFHAAGAFEKYWKQIEHPGKD